MSWRTMDNQASKLIKFKSGSQFTVTGGMEVESHGQPPISVKHLKSKQTTSIINEVGRKRKS